MKNKLKLILFSIILTCSLSSCFLFGINMPDYPVNSVYIDNNDIFDLYVWIVSPSGQQSQKYFVEGNRSVEVELPGEIGEHTIYIQRPQYTTKYSWKIKLHNEETYTIYYDIGNGFKLKS